MPVPRYRIGVALFLLIAACGSPGVDAPRTVSTADPPTQGTALQAIAAPWNAAGDRSGFAPVARGRDALGARLGLIEAAGHSIDLQTFEASPDISVRLVASRLIAAADRGARVRILVDDIFTSVSDDQFAALDTHPNIEVRIFSPLIRGVPMPVGYLVGLPRTNRRMHSKAIIFDNAIAIVGGRNMGDEYFEADRGIEFADFDVLAVGPVAAEVSEAFDRFWNDDLAVPLAAIRPPRARAPAPILAPDELAEAGRIFDDAVASTILADLHAGRLRPDTAPALVVADPPEKLRVHRGQGEQAVLEALSAELAQATEEVIFVTPYFVPRADGVAALSALSRRGVEVTVITNSLASTNHAVVHGGYAPHRRALLEAGVRLYEARPDTAVSRLTGDPVRLTLHGKAIVMDRQRALVGSLNLDPRSTELNSELAIFIESEPFAGRMAAAIDANLPLHAYALRLDDTGRMVWEAGTGADRQVWYSDPGASLWRRFVAGLVAILPLVEDQL